MLCLFSDHNRPAAVAKVDMAQVIRDSVDIWSVALDKTLGVYTSNLPQQERKQILVNGVCGTLGSLMNSPSWSYARRQRPCDIPFNEGK